MAEVLYAFFCEDLRVEQSGQTTAVGIWGERAYVGAFPAMLKSLAFHAYVSNHAREHFHFVVHMRGPFDPGEIRQEGDLVMEGHHIGQNINLLLAPVVFTEPGVMSATLVIGSDPPIERTIRLEVSLRQPVANNLPEPAQAL
ncbi:hypothetical protein BH11MYX4_BH11MYX4_05470 [soil metagenome]